MPGTDMAEGIEHAFLGQDAIAKRDFGAKSGQLIGHGHFLG
jgi:hypothetical protein